MIGRNLDQIWFNRRKTNEKFGSKIEKYDQIRINSIVMQYADLSGKVMAGRGITRDDYLKFFQDSNTTPSDAMWTGTIVIAGTAWTNTSSARDVVRLRVLIHLPRPYFSSRPKYPMGLRAPT